MLKKVDKKVQNTQLFIISAIYFRSNLSSHPCIFQGVLFYLFIIFLFTMKEEKLRGRPGYEHLCDPLHILVEAELPSNIVDTRLRQAQEIIEELLKPVVCSLPLLTFYHNSFISNMLIHNITLKLHNHN